MKKFFTFFLLLILFSAAYAQDFGELAADLVTTLRENLEGFGLIPKLNVDCDQTEGEKCDLLGSNEVRAFFIVLITIWMILSVVWGMKSTSSAIFSFFITSLMFNYLTTFFRTDVMGLFRFVFSGLFIFIWLEYIFKYLFAFSRTTKLLLEFSITMMALFFMDILNLFDILSKGLTYLVSGVGIVLFMVFMVVMRIVNGYSRILSIKATKDLKAGGSRSVIDSGKDVQTQMDSAAASVEAKK